MDTYIHPTYGVGYPISEQRDFIVYRFDNPPGMAKDSHGIVPVVIVPTFENVEGEEE